MVADNDNEMIIFSEGYLGMLDCPLKVVQEVLSRELIFIAN
jgi:hypothetical protein